MIKRLTAFLIMALGLGNTAMAEWVDYGTQHLLNTLRRGGAVISVHVCGNSGVMVGAHVQANQFACENDFPIATGKEPFARKQIHYNSVSIIANQDHQSHGMAACPPGYAMVGLHHAENVLACIFVSHPRYGGGAYPTAWDDVELLVDSHTYAPRGTVNMHVCPPGWFMVGIHEARDLLLCARFKR